MVHCPMWKFTLIITTVFVLLVLTEAFAFAGSVEVPANVRVGIVTNNAGSQFRNASHITFKVKGSYQLLDLSAIPGAQLITPIKETETWQIYYLSSGIQLYKDGQPVKVTTGPVVVREESHASSNRAFLENYTTGGNNKAIGRWYRGNMEFRSSGDGLVAINELPMDEYLSGVVPREMSNGWPLEALKAQAIAARTYTVANFNKRIVEGFNMLDTPSDQAYGGYSSEGSNSNQAVFATSGKILLFDGAPISAVYHSTSGGHTEDNENVWNGKPISYLRGKKDPYSTKHGLANWSYTSTTDFVRDKLVQSGIQINAISSLTLEKYPSGRIKTVIIKDVNGNTVTRTGSQFGKMFNPGFYTYINNESFMSNFFDVKTDLNSEQNVFVMNSSGTTVKVKSNSLYGVNSANEAEVLNNGSDSFTAVGASGTVTYSKASSGKFVFEGHGWGHGVGMSQWGAYEMAQQGKSYIDILKFYYTGAQLN